MPYLTVRLLPSLDTGSTKEKFTFQADSHHKPCTCVPPSTHVCRCKRTERDALLQLLVATRGVTLISSQEAEAAGGGVEGAVSRQEAEEFLRRYREAGGQGGAAGAGAAAGTGAGAGAGAAQVVVVEDDDFGDME